MPAKHHRHIALTEPLLHFVDEQVAEGRHASANEVVRAALRLLMEREDARLGKVGVTAEDTSVHG